MEKRSERRFACRSARSRGWARPSAATLSCIHFKTRENSAIGRPPSPLRGGPAARLHHGLAVRFRGRGRGHWSPCRLAGIVAQPPPFGPGRPTTGGSPIGERERRHRESRHSGHFGDRHDGSPVLHWRAWRWVRHVTTGSQAGCIAARTQRGVSPRAAGGWSRAKTAGRGRLTDRRGRCGRIADPVSGPRRRIVVVRPLVASATSWRRAVWWMAWQV